uniref:Uncharacterized protein n=1 Tax=Helicotheca tamesis TaxID=374047 RepID=A0A7S2H4R4_9STRA|mmetsp:Transcript_15200/g.20753  ORF Transcript_15200/g.20753 Transcript_15200/m.20753 type:complete len:170 (+) Transcript_15200:13-522(+)
MIAVVVCCRHPTNKIKRKNMVTSTKAKTNNDDSPIQQNEMFQPSPLKKYGLEDEITQPAPSLEKVDMGQNVSLAPPLGGVKCQGGISDSIPFTPSESKEKQIHHSSKEEKPVDWDDEKLRPIPLIQPIKPCFPPHHGPMGHLTNGSINKLSMSSFNCSSRSIIWERKEG